VPDSLQLMSYLTALCPNAVDLGTAPVILPWHDPLRVAEQAAVLAIALRCGVISDLRLEVVRPQTSHQ
jgi:hypothetical protein